MEPRDIYKAPRERRGKYVMNALKLGESPFAAVLFLYAVLDYKVSPNKKKALFIYSEFLYDACNGGPPPGMGLLFLGKDGIDLNINVEFKDETKEKLKSAFDQMTMDRTRAKKMFFLKRWATSGGRKADEKVFDSALREVLDCDRTQSPFGLTILGSGLDSTTVQSQNAYQQSVSQLPDLKNRMEECGFDLGLIGLADRYGEMTETFRVCGF